MAAATILNFVYRS